MLKIKRQTKIKYRRRLEKYFLKKYTRKLSHQKYPGLISKRSQLRLI